MKDHRSDGMDRLIMRLWLSSLVFAIAVPALSVAGCERASQAAVLPYAALNVLMLACTVKDYRRGNWSS